MGKIGRERERKREIIGEYVNIGDKETKFLFF